MKQDCEICAKIIKSDELFSINKFRNGIIRDMLKLCSCEINSDLTTSNVICKDCLDDLKISYNLKFKCLLTEQQIVNHMVKHQDYSKINLSQVFHHDDKHQACRICSQILIDDYQSITKNETIEEMLKICCSEMDLLLTEDPIICSACVRMLKISYQFSKTCSIMVEQKTKEMQKEISPSNHVQNNQSIDVRFNISNGYFEIPVIDLERTLEEVFGNVCGSKNYSQKNVPRNQRKRALINSSNKSIEASYDGNEASKSMSSPEKQVMVEKVVKKRRDSLKNCQKPKKCPHCSSLIKGQLQFIKHLETHSTCRYKCQFCPSEFAIKKNMKRHELGHSSRNYNKYKCPKCTYQTHSQKQINIHQIVHASKLKYKCALCTHTTQYKGNLRKHMSKHDEKIYKCKSCSFSTKWAESIALHTKMVHETHVGPYLYCANCDYKTRAKQMLIDHVLVHQKHPENIRYKCDKCPFIENRSSVYNFHLKMHVERKKNPKSVYLCKICHYMTNQISKVTQHEAKHEVNKFKCKKCNYSSKWMRNLTRHNAIHVNNTVMFFCKQCNYSTHEKARLTEHEFVHADVKRYKCKLCDFASNWRKSMIRHTAAVGHGKF